MTNRILRGAVLGAVFAAVAACATPTGEMAASRFDTFEMMSSRSLSSYDQVYIAPVTASAELVARVDYRTAGPSDRVRPLGQRDLDGRIAELEDDLRREIGMVAELVDAPGPGVLTVAVELTDLDANRPTQAELAQSPGLSMQSVAAGKAAATVIFADGDETLARGMDARIGDLNDVILPAATWSEADRFFDSFAGKVAALLS
jgi:hypothetical protein